MKKILTGIGGGAVMLIVAMLVGQVFQAIMPSLMGEYQNQNLFRPWSDPIMSFYFAQPFVLGLILVWVWDWTKGIIKGKNNASKGLRFGLIYWVITIPGMLMSYSSFPLSLLLVCSWSFSILVQALCIGFLFSKIRS